jgi:hypothetical protein
MTIYPGPCAIDLTDLADIFTVSRANIFRKKPNLQLKRISQSGDIVDATIRE